MASGNGRADLHFMHFLVDSVSGMQRSPLAISTPDPLVLKPVALHSGHGTTAGRPFLRARTVAQIEPDHESAERRAIHETVSRWLEPISRHMDQRREPRTLFVRPVLVVCSQNGANREDNILATTIDISYGGLGLVTPRMFTSEQVILHMLDVRFVAEVCWSREIGNRIHRYGLRFLTVVAFSR